MNLKWYGAGMGYGSVGRFSLDVEYYIGSWGLGGRVTYTMGQAGVTLILGPLDLTIGCTIRQYPHD